MNELTASNVKTYEDLKNQLNAELNKAAISFVRIGYLLKTARDTDILQGTAYADVNDFASAEFGLDKSQVSRFMRINDRFSISGYSEHLKTEYEGYGSAKLSLMLLLPDEINEELSPEFSKTDIQAIKEEYEEEQKISDLEVMMEDKTDVPDEFIAAVVKQLNDEHEGPIVYLHNTLNLAKKMNVEVQSQDIKEAYMPDGDRTYTIRIPAQGRFMVNCKEQEITIVNMRDPGNKSPLSWDEFMKAVLADEATRSFVVKDEPKETPKQKKVEKSKAKDISKVAPVQPKKEEPKTEEPKPAAGVERVEAEVIEPKRFEDQTGQQAQETEEDRTDRVEGWKKYCELKARLKLATTTICDKYCKWPNEWPDDEEHEPLHEAKCKYCPLNELLEEVEE